MKKANAFLMKSCLIIVSSLALTACSWSGGELPTGNATRPHDLAFKTTAELHALVTAQPELLNNPVDPADPDRAELQAALNAGQRAYDWIKLLNQHRAGQPPLSYSDAASAKSFPIDRPKVYNLALVKQRYSDLLQALPEAYKDVVTGTDPLPLVMPVSETEFLKWGLEVTSAYDTAVRWLMMKPWFADLRKGKFYDIRGYVYLSQLTDRDQKLATFATLTSEEQARIRQAFVDLCINNQEYDHVDIVACRTSVQATEAAGQWRDVLAQQLPTAEQRYREFFMIEPTWKRSDIVWNAQDASTLHYPFLQPADPEIASYLKDNVEDEFRIAGFQLRIDFTSVSTPTLSHLEFESGVTPHAGENTIVMDANEPRTEYSSRWTIRHEFGHLLGFPDCYVEFYDDDISAIVNYQLDPENLMCSRRGHLQPQHIDVLRAAYFSP